MKATIDIPEDLYRKVKAKSALAGMPVREVTEMLYRNWLADGADLPASESPDAWLQRWLALADAVHEDAPKGPSAREVLAEDRDRLAPK